MDIKKVVKIKRLYDGAGRDPSNSVTRRIRRTDKLAVKKEALDWS